MAVMDNQINDQYEYIRITHTAAQVLYEMFVPIPLQDPMNGQVFMQGNMVATALLVCFVGTTVMEIVF